MHIIYRVLFCIFDNLHVLRRDIWIEKSGRKESFDEEKHTHICEAHFQDSDLCPMYKHMKQSVPKFKGLPKLKIDAVPSKNIPGGGSRQSANKDESKYYKQKIYFVFTHDIIHSDDASRDDGGGDNDGSHAQVIAPVRPTTVEASSPIPKKRTKSDSAPSMDISGCSIGTVTVDTSIDPGANDSDYVPSRSSILMASQELGETYMEHENGDDEEPGPIMDDVDDMDTDVQDGFVLIDIAILLNLVGQFCFTSKCNEKVSVTQRRSGAMISLQVNCSKGHSNVIRTQKLVKCQPEGNVLLANAILTSGMTFATWRRFCTALKMPCISNTTYYALIKKYVMPIIFTTWYNAREAGLAAVRASETAVTWVADGQFDSAGYSAKYLVETIMCASSGKIIMTF